jgi:hypothetical protein
MANDVGLKALAARLNDIGEIFTGDMTPMANVTARKAKQTAVSVANSVTGGDSVLSHMGKRGGHLQSDFDIDNSGRRITIKLHPYGPWALTEKGAKPHTIPRATRARGSFLYSPSYSHPVRGPIRHRGAPGIRRQSITRTWDKLHSEMPENYHRAYLEVLANKMA